MNEAEKDNGRQSVTIMLPGGKLPGAVLQKVTELRKVFTFDIYLTTAQNMRLYNIEKSELAPIKAALVEVGATFKKPGLFPLPKVCIGSGNCKLGLADTDALSEKIIEHFKDLENVKPKFKIAISGCPAMCSGALLTDIGVVATRNGYDIYAGGKGGPTPKVARRVARNLEEGEALRIIREIVDFHQRKTTQKQRIFKLLDDPEFPSREDG
ncbi:MAG: nitrite reductase [Proteobacteria bacterium]|nr:nitrite reductase [Pseudomonadota bacterium]MBU1738136.1 nitrite reductase [Pseudomonadota bacterium]